MERREGRIFEGKSLEDVATAFAECVSRNHLENLEFWRATAMDDLGEVEYWNQRMKKEPSIVKKVVYSEVLSIMQNADAPENKKFHSRKRFFGREKNKLSITAETGFFEAVLRECAMSTPVNVEYIIDLKNFYIDKIIH